VTIVGQPCQVAHEFCDPADADGSHVPGSSREDSSPWALVRDVMAAVYGSRTSQRALRLVAGRRKGSAVPIQTVTTSALIAGLPKRWYRFRAKAKVVGAAMTSNRDKVVTLSDDGKHIDLMDADKFDAERVTDEHDPEAAGQAAPTGESGA
jgi:hypothetical protein